MAKYAVSYINWFDHDLLTVIVEATDWMDALHKHPKVASFDHGTFSGTFRGSYEDAKKAAFDCNCMINVTEIPS